MSEQVVDPNTVTLERFQSGEELDFEFGVIPDDSGDLYFLRHHVAPVDHYGSFLNLGERGMRYSAFEITRDKATRIARDGSDFVNALGYQHMVDRDESGDIVDLTTVPSPGYLNSAMAKIYNATKENYPLTFVSNENQFGHITGKEFIERLADGEIVLSSPRDVHMFQHDTIAHAIGYCKINPGIALAIQFRAKQLKDEGKLVTVGEKYGGHLNSSELAEEQAIDFADAVDSLSDLLTRDGRRQNWEREYIRKHITTIIASNGPPILSGAKAQLMYLGLMKHQGWLEQRALELKATA